MSPSTRWDCNEPIWLWVSAMEQTSHSSPESGQSITPRLSQRKVAPGQDWPHSSLCLGNLGLKGSITHLRFRCKAVGAINFGNKCKTYLLLLKVQRRKAEGVHMGNDHWISVFTESNMKCEIIRKIFYKDSLVCAQKIFSKYFLFCAFPLPPAKQHKHKVGHFLLWKKKSFFHHAKLPR